MKKIAIIALVSIIAVGIIAFSMWMNTTDVGAKPLPPKQMEAKAAPQPEPPKPEAAPEPEPAIEIATPEPVQEPVAAPAPAPPAALTAATLVKTNWQGDMVDFEFLPDGRWRMGARICAKWEIVGDKVRVYDDKGEEHFFDIVGDSIAFNGKKLGKIPK